MRKEMVEKGARTEISVVVLLCHSAELSLPFIVVPTHIDGNEQVFFVALHSVERKRIGDAAINEEAVPHFNGAEKVGIDMEARMAWKRLPWEKMTSRPLL